MKIEDDPELLDRRRFFWQLGKCFFLLLNDNDWFSSLPTLHFFLRIASGELETFSTKLLTHFPMATLLGKRSKIFFIIEKKIPLWTMCTTMCILSKSSQDIWDNPLHFNIEGNFLFSVHLVGILLNAGFKRNIRLQNLKLLCMQNPFFLFFGKAAHTQNWPPLITRHTRPTCEKKLK